VHSVGEVTPVVQRGKGRAETPKARKQKKPKTSAFDEAFFRALEDAHMAGVVDVLVDEVVEDQCYAAGDDMVGFLGLVPGEPRALAERYVAAAEEPEPPESEPEPEPVAPQPEEEATDYAALRPAAEAPAPDAPETSDAEAADAEAGEQAEAPAGEQAEAQAEETAAISAEGEAAIVAVAAAEAGGEAQDERAERPAESEQTPAKDLTGAADVTVDPLGTIETPEHERAKHGTAAAVDAAPDIMDLLNRSKASTRSLMSGLE